MRGSSGRRPLRGTARKWLYSGRRRLPGRKKTSLRSLATLSPVFEDALNDTMLSKPKCSTDWGDVINCNRWQVASRRVLYLNQILVVRNYQQTKLN